jgi:predicted esterase
MPLCVLAWLTLTTPITLSGLGYLVSGLVLSIGLIAAPWRQQLGRGITPISLGLILLTASLRLVTPSSSTMMVTALPAASPRWLNHLIAEQDLVLFGERLAALSGRVLSVAEDADLVPALYRAYQAMETTDHVSFSPIVSTALHQQQPDAFDVVIVEPSSGVPHAAVLFLHGFAGNFTIQCWLVAQAAREIQAVTVCPSVGWRGMWWTPDGEQIVRTTIAYLRQRGIERIYLAGSSNGGIGVTHLAPRLSGDLVGLIFISGVDADVPLPALPSVIVQGTTDARMPALLARQAAQAAGAGTTYHEVPGDHFILAKQADMVRMALGNWLQDHEQGRAP